MKQTLYRAARNLDDAIEARMLFQPNAKTATAFDAEVLGRYERNGPNPWDTYRFVAGPEDPMRIFPGIEIQVAPAGAVFRIRARGAVLRVAWVAAEEFDEEARRAAFLERCVTGFTNSRGIGATAFIARTLDAGRRPSGGGA